jgi:hypothetical protein
MADMLPLDRKKLSAMMDVDPDRVDKAAAAVADAIEDPIISNSLSVCLYARRLSMIALTAVDRQLKLLVPEDTDIAMRIIRETSQALRDPGKFTVHDLEADTCELIPPYFEGLAAATMFQMQIEQDEQSTVADLAPGIRAERFAAAAKRAKPAKPAKRKRSS